MVGTTVKQPDEKHTTISGEKVYAATTVDEHCFLGASIAKRTLADVK